MPPAVRAGDKVAVVAPAGPVNAERLRRGLDRLSGRLRLDVPDDIARVDGFLAGSDEARAAELDRALRDPDVRAILLARGGYGIARILPMLDPALLRHDPKPIVGFSDGTALLAWADRAGVRPIHGPVVAQLGELPVVDTDTLVRVLTDPAPLGRIATRLVPTGAPMPGEITGRLGGGNLCLLSNLVGTPWQPDLTGAIVILEEIGEKPYAIDRYLTHIANARAFAGAAAMLVGDFTRCTDPPTAPGRDDDPAPALAVVDERMRHLGLPGLRGAPVGHGARNVCLPWGARATLHRDGTVEILDGAVV